MVEPCQYCCSYRFFFTPPLQGKVICDRCNPGYFQDTTNGQVCRPCTAGSFCAGQGTVVPAPCQMREFCPQLSSRSALCPLGFYCEQPDTKMPCDFSTDFCPLGSISRESCPDSAVCAYQVPCKDIEPDVLWLNYTEAVGSDTLGTLPECSR